MLDLKFLTGVAKGNILGNISLYSIPPIGTSYSFQDEWNKWTHEPSEVSYPSIP
jgi:hypothetical protein